MLSKPRHCTPDPRFQTKMEKLEYKPLLTSNCNLRIKRPDGKIYCYRWRNIYFFIQSHLVAVHLIICKFLSKSLGGKSFLLMCLYRRGIMAEPIVYEELGFLISRDAIELSYLHGGRNDCLRVCSMVLFILVWIVP